MLDMSVADQLEYTLYLYNVGEDGFDFTASPGSCFIPVDTGLPVYLGEGRTVLATADLDLDELGACPVPADTDGDGLIDMTRRMWHEPCGGGHGRWRCVRRRGGCERDEPAGGGR